MATRPRSVGRTFTAPWRAEPARIIPNSTLFFGSQIGGKSVINYSYTDMPWKLLAFDVYYFFTFAWAIPFILLPITPSDSGELDELSFTHQNIFCIAIHFILCVLQLAFLLSLPFAVLFPLWTVALGIALFTLVNYGLCTFLNGKETEYHSDPQYAPELPEHDHEQWIFINGVAVGEHWMKNNLNRLALTFKRPVLGIHNKTNGIFLDIVECLVQRSLGYATSDVRVCYSIIKEKLYNPKYSKVIFILHSQGGIEGSLILDWLLQELPQDLLCKLEVYTFGNAANHFNNPHRYVGAQAQAMRNPALASVDASHTADGNGHASSRPPTPTSPPPEGSDGDNSAAAAAGPAPAPVRDQPSHFALRSETSSTNPASVSYRAIGHIEHYAHTTDFVALWGVLHFATSARGSPILPRFIGRVFARTSARGGHQLCQHYLDGMFPLARDPATGLPARDERAGGYVGCADGEGENEFMESEVVVGAEGSELDMAREAMELSWLGTGPDVEVEVEVEVEVHAGGGSPVEPRGRYRSRACRGKPPGAKMKVKDLSRLWQYRNGKSPGEKPPLLATDPDGFVRNATM